MLKEANKGLSTSQANKRLEEYGLNEIKDLSKHSALNILFRQIKSNFIIYLLFVAMILSFFVGKSLTAYVILLVLIVVIVTGFIQEYKAEKAIEKLKGMVTPISLVIRDGKEIEIQTTQIVPGDLLILRTGEKIPADCIVLTEKDLLLNEAILTGEAVEVKKMPVVNLKNPKDENLIYAGSFIVNGKCTAKVIHTGMNTKFGKIAGMISTAEKELPLQKKVNVIAKYMSIIGITMALLTAGLVLLNSNQLTQEVYIEALIIFIAIAVSSFPEGFPVVLITALSSGAYRMAQKNAIVNRMSIIETLGETTVICSDKTGTITKGEMTVRKVYCDNTLFDLTGVGFEANGEFLFKNRKVNLNKEETLKLLLKTSVVCNDSKIKRSGESENIYTISGAPTEASLLIMAAKANMFKEDLKEERIDEIPFSSERKFMTVLTKEGRKEIVYSKGAIDVLIKKCKYIKRRNGVFRLLKKDVNKILEENKKMTSQAMRTLAIAYKEKNSKKDSIDNDLIFLGFVGMEDPPRDGVEDALIRCKKAGIKIKMITGDDKETALSVAKQIGLEPGKILEGYELDKITEDELTRIVNEVVVFARVKPEHKLKIVKALKQNGEIVTMTGDGVNDAPALKEAHIGVAMGRNGTDVSRSVADLTLKDDNFVTLIDAIKEGRTIFTNIQKFSTYQISVNFSQVSLIFLAILAGLPLPLVAIQILFMNLFSDEITAITLAFNPYSNDVMESKPRRKSSIITKPLFLMLMTSGLIMCLGSLAVFYYTLTIGKSQIAARTIVFVTMVLFGITNAFNYRSFRKPTLTRSPFVNKPLVYASLAAIILTIAIIYTPMSKAFESIAIPPIYWLIALLVSLSVLVVFDTLKHLNEKYHFWTDDLQSFNYKKRKSKIKNI